ncbi:MAG TPA: hypothetical protein VIG99_08495 [Myxococcaceae bacterium]|jgi:hypothetical protein
MRPALLLALAMAVAAPACAPTLGTLRDEYGESPDAARCTSDLECSAGDECIRPRGQINGLCGHVADANGQPTTGIRRRVEPCTNDFECPVRSRCELTTSSVGVCVGQ